MGLNLFCWFGALCMSASVVHLSRKNPMGGVCGGGKIIPQFPQLWGVWGRGVVFKSCLSANACQALPPCCTGSRGGDC